MGTAHRCHVSGCAAVATDRCFECGVWCCDEHRTAVQIPTYTGAFSEYLCATCLLSHLEAPDRYGLITVEHLPPSVASQSVNGAELAF